MRDLFKNFFHKHTYSLLGTIEVEGYVTYFMECETCHKRDVLLDEHCRYSKQVKKIFKLWKKHEVELNFEEIKEMSEMKEIALDKEELEALEHDLIYKRTVLFTELQTYLKLTRSKISIYENYENLNIAEAEVLAEHQALADFLDDKVNDLNRLLSTYDDFVRELSGIIEQLDTENIYNIKELFKGWV